MRFLIISLVFLIFGMFAVLLKDQGDEIQASLDMEKPSPILVDSKVSRDRITQENPAHIVQPSSTTSSQLSYLQQRLAEAFKTDEEDFSRLFAQELLRDEELICELLAEKEWLQEVGLMPDFLGDLLFEHYDQSDDFVGSLKAFEHCQKNQAFCLENKSDFYLEAAKSDPDATLHWTVAHARGANLCNEIYEVGSHYDSLESAQSGLHRILQSDLHPSMQQAFLQGLLDEWAFEDLAETHKFLVQFEGSIILDSSIVGIVEQFIAGNQGEEALRWVDHLYDDVLADTLRRQIIPQEKQLSLSEEVVGEFNEQEKPRLEGDLVILKDN